MKENYKKPFNRLKYAERSLIAINTNLKTYPVALVVTYIYVCVALLQHSILISAMSSKMAMSSSTSRGLLPKEHNHVCRVSRDSQHPDVIPTVNFNSRFSCSLHYGRACCQRRQKKKKKTRSRARLIK